MEGMSEGIDQKEQAEKENQNKIEYNKSLPYTS